ncbi:hypothetical protein [Arcticibacter sp.]|uniref:hypothetical protein n=1 Tax=Arcticibacter sp. TaxID=1872630 RepID=UPI0038906BBF
MSTEFAVPTPGVSFKKMIIAMEVGQKLPFPIKYHKSIRPIISSDIKIEYPEREYSTTTKQIKDALTVIREK